MQQPPRRQDRHGTGYQERPDIHPNDAVLVRPYISASRRKVRPWNEDSHRDYEQVIEPEVTQYPGSAAILPLVDDRHICLIRSRRLTVGEILIEIPAGTREPNEEPLETACPAWRSASRSMSRWRYAWRRA